MRSALAFPFDADTIFRKKKQLKRLLEERRDLVGKRIAVMGGSTTREIIDLLELFLLDQGIKPEFYESAYGAFEHELLFDNDRLKQFKPDVVFIHTNLSNVKFFPSMRDSEEEVRSKLDKEFARFRALWEKVHEAYHCSVVQNNFELPPLRVLGNRDAVDHRGRTGFILGLNQEFAGYARDRRNVFINDIEYLSSWIGLERWCDRPFWHSYKYSLSHEAMPYFCHNLASIIQAMFGKSRKCVVVDLDNTLWGGVIGEDGVNKISLGKDTPLGEAFLEFQGYLKRLKERGILLAVCSKNDLSNALAGLNHPDAVLKPDDFSVIKANWDPKPENIRAIARELNIGEDSLVFIDDDPVEREAVRTFLPAVSVPEVGEDICLFADMIDKNNYFEPLWIGADDVDRSAVYAQEDKRKAAAAAFSDQGEFLRSLSMQAEIKPFAGIYLDRIAQLVNKTNQFNLTVRRVTLPEIEALASDPDAITLYGRLKDKFGESGLVTVFAGRINECVLSIELWLMSCRVINRGMEYALFDALVHECQRRGVSTVIGRYVPTEKNKMVSLFYRDLGFSLVSGQAGEESVWKFDVPAAYADKNAIIEVTHG